jgi:guanylate kinase
VFITVLTGPAGGGKTSTQKGILALQEEGKIPVRFGKVVTTLTRERRVKAGEIDGVHNHFWTVSRFLQGIENGEFVEHVIHNGDHYGMRHASIRDIPPGLLPLVALETLGAENLKRNSERLIGIPAMVISIDVPEPKDILTVARMRERGDAEEDIARRSVIAQWERKRIAEGGFCDHHVVNVSLPTTILEVLRLTSVCPVLV